MPLAPLRQTSKSFTVLEASAHLMPSWSTALFTSEVWQPLIHVSSSLPTTLSTCDAVAARCFSLSLGLRPAIWSERATSP